MQMTLMGGEVSLDFCFASSSLPVHHSLRIQKTAELDWEMPMHNLSDLTKNPEDRAST
jgi:hypothetical protein